ncbi:excinuclease ABC subunit B [alpha proteobacterium BAL199]|jgi:NAD(P)-dependent dehydrogenase (short-subunit alcohol dehydrogenase family)|nr:excinuclease ABC subunit B [alpha proteobacterium BAL199]
MTQRIPNPVPRTAFITGAGRRVGRAIALRLAQGGWNIAIHYGRSRDEAEATAGEIRLLGVKATTLAADLAREDQVQTLLASATDVLGPIGLLVNNASMFEPDRLSTVTRASWDSHMAANLRAPVVLMQSFAALLPADCDGAIVNILDQRVWNPTEDFLSYTVTKAALWSLTQTLALDLAPRIRVCGVGPGPTLANARQATSEFDAQASSVPLRHSAEPTEIADTVAFLADARSVTGQMIAVDGGQHLWWAPPSDSTPRD